MQRQLGRLTDSACKIEKGDQRQQRRPFFKELSGLADDEIYIACAKYMKSEQQSNQQAKIADRFITNALVAAWAAGGWLYQNPIKK